MHSEKEESTVGTIEAAGTTVGIDVTAVSSSAAALTTGLAAAGAAVCGSAISGIVAASVDDHGV